MTVENAPTIDPKRLWQRHMDFAAIGATPAGGVHRLALTDLDIQAHVVLADLAGRRGFSIELDDIGNMFIRRAGRDDSLPPVASGSHTDTQSKGGRFDGILGVLTAFEALEAIDDAGIVTDHPLECIVWNNEEGSRFIPACMGSAVYAGAEPLDAMLAQTDADGITMGACVEALKAALPHAGHRALGAPLNSFIEAHIEQGPEMEANGTVIGAVTGMQGYRRFTVSVKGEAAHSGTTPRARRNDAFLVASSMAQKLAGEITDQGDVVRFTIGRFSIVDGGISIVPGHVEFTIDLRHPERSALEQFGDRIVDICHEMAGACQVEVDEFINQMPLDFAEVDIAAIEAIAEGRGYPHQRIYSTAGHDARHAARVGDACMLFVPCWKGISHNEAERAEPEHAAAAAQVITDFMLSKAYAR